MRRNLFLVLALVIVVPVIVSGTSRISSFQGTSRQVNEAEAKLKQLKQENANLQKELQYKSSGSYAEEEIRNKLGMVKPGETEVIIPKQKRQGRSQNSQQDQVPNWQKWRDLFLGRS